MRRSDTQSHRQSFISGDEVLNEIWISSQAEVKARLKVHLVTAAFQVPILISKLKLVESRLEKLETEIKEIREAGVFISFEEIPDSKAKIKIEKVIADAKETRIKEIDDFEIMERLNLPIEQVDRILGELEKEGTIRERRK